MAEIAGRLKWAEADRIGSELCDVRDQEEERGSMLAAYFIGWQVARCNLRRGSAPRATPMSLGTRVKDQVLPDAGQLTSEGPLIVQSRR